MPLKTNIDEAPALNLTPMIDIVFLIIIFFMVGTTFTESERKIDFQLPKVAENAALTAAPKRRAITLYADGTISYERETVTAEQLIAKLKAATLNYADQGVVIRGDADSRLQNLTTVMNACAAADVKDIGIAVELRNEQPE